MPKRRSLVRERSRERQRLERTLEDAPIKLDTVVASLLSVSGRAMIEAMIAGERDPRVLARMAPQPPLCAAAPSHGAGLSGEPSGRLAFLGSNRLNAPFGYTSGRLDRRSYPERPAARCGLLMTQLLGSAALPPHAMAPFVVWPEVVADPAERLRRQGAVERQPAHSADQAQQIRPSVAGRGRGDDWLHGVDLPPCRCPGTVWRVRSRAGRSRRVATFANLSSAIRLVAIRAV